MLETHACVTAGCDQCGEDGCDQWDYPPHWPTEAAALADLATAGWQVTGRRVVCRRCVAVLACQAHGHQLSPWQACLCGPRRLPGHPPGPGGACGVAYRSCGRCGLAEQRPAPAADGVGVA